LLNENLPLQSKLPLYTHKEGKKHRSLQFFLGVGSAFATPASKIGGGNNFQKASEKLFDAKF